MRITSVHVYPLEVPMGKPIKMAGETITHAQTVLLRVVDDEAREGWGEASAAPLMTGETLGSLTASASYLAQKLVGAQLEHAGQIDALHDRVLYGNGSARSCHETALMDLLAQRLGLPLYRLLRGSTADRDDGRLEMLHMLASGDLERELDEAHTLRAQGYRQWKIKVGTGDTANDVRRVRALSKALAGDVVSADANQGLSVEAAQAIARAGVEGGLSFLEQPYRVGMLQEMVQLHSASGLALCADESIQDASDIVTHADLNAAQGISLKLIKLGGTRALLAAGRLCLERGMRVNLACKVAETTISAAATAHAGFALGEVAWGFSMSNRYLAHDVCADPLVPDGGAVTAAQLQRPGLGFAPEAALMRDFASKDWAVREFFA